MARLLVWSISVAFRARVLSSRTSARGSSHSRRAGPRVGTWRANRETGTQRMDERRALNRALASGIASWKSRACPGATVGPADRPCRIDRGRRQHGGLGDRRRHSAAPQPHAANPELPSKTMLLSESDECDQAERSPQLRCLSLWPADSSTAGNN